MAAAGFKINYSPGSKRVTTMLHCLPEACAKKSHKSPLPPRNICGVSGACGELQILIDGGTCYQ